MSSIQPEVPGTLYRRRRAALLVTLASALWLVACASDSHLLSHILDIPPSGHDPGAVPVTHFPRRTPLREQEHALVTKEYMAAILERQKRGAPPDWPSIFQNLPRDDEDNIDWNQALSEGVIKPRPGIEAGSAETEVLETDALLATSGKPERRVVFSHKSHGQWLSCDNCHPAIFEKKTGAAHITMKLIDDGQYCGVCHDKVAVALPSSCKAGCHVITGQTGKK